LLPSLEAVKSLYTESDIGVCFMLSKHPSYQPFEYLAAGVAPVVNRNAATAWMLEDEQNCLVTEPFTSSIADAVTRLVDDADLRRSIAKRGREQVTATEWDEELERVWEFITGADR
jgi:glycosyltransferase involved in cell wall biosynthesis